MEHIPCSQEHTTCPYPEVDKSSPHPPILLYQDSYTLSFCLHIGVLNIPVF
jgi:hypothetical protein